MSNYVTIPTTEWEQYKNDIAFIKKALLSIARGYKQPVWISEADAMEMTGKSERTLRELAKGGILEYATDAKGRNYKYKRTSIENYEQINYKPICG